jgi:hypothetical protein
VATRSGSVSVRFNNAAPALLARVAAPAVAKAAEIVADEQRRLIPVSKDGSYGRPPGYARDHIGVWATEGPGGTYYDVGSDATTPDGVSYPAILDTGSKPHIIESHGNYPLRNRATGQAFGKVVHHPGTQPTYWCRLSIYALVGREL